MKENITTHLYKLFIPETPKPVRVQAVNPLLPESKKEILDRKSSKKEWFLGKPIICESFKHTDSFNVGGKPEAERIDTLDDNTKKGVLERKFTQKEWYVGNSTSSFAHETKSFAVNKKQRSESFCTLGEMPKRSALDRKTTSKEWFFGKPIVCESYYHTENAVNKTPDTKSVDPLNKILLSVKKNDSTEPQISNQNESRHSVYHVYSEDLEKSISNKEIEEETFEDFENILDDGEDEKVPFLDELIRKSIDITGSIYALAVVTFIIIAWVVWGIVENAPDVWQIAMQDGQSIQTYVWDTFLMRQQLDDTHQFLKVQGRLQSRTLTLKKLLVEFNTRKECGDLPCGNNDHNGYNLKCSNESNSDEEVAQNISAFTKFSVSLAKILGSLESITVYWIGIFIWIGCGALVRTTGNTPPFTGKYSGDNPEYGTFSNNWQMYINTAVAIELLITSVFLENVRFTNTVASTKYFNSFIEYDTKLELKLRGLTGYVEDNEHVIVYPCPRVGIKKYISFYAGVVGNGLGLLITTIVFVAWLAVGNLMNWNDNWWLIIGTYTGLIGFIDGFILRETYFDMITYEEKMFGNIVDESQKLLDIAGLEYNLRNATISVPKRYLARLNLKVSRVVSDICSTTSAVIFSVLFVVGLIIMGCVLHWSATAQLIANTPTMIIEGFFLLILIQAEDWANSKRTKTIQELVVSRKLLFQYIGGDDVEL